MKKTQLTNKEFEKHFITLNRKGISTGKAFDRFIDLAIDAIMLKNTPDENIETYSNMFGDLVKIMDISSDENGVCKDYLGDFFMEHITFGENGQYFTPQHISDLMAKISLIDKKGSILEKLSVADNTGCGSGRNLLAAAKVLGKRNIIANGVDIDIRCCKMAVLNLFFNGIDGEILWMDGLKLEFRGGRKIRMYPFPRVEEIKSIEKEKITEIKKEIVELKQHNLFT